MEGVRGGWGVGPAAVRFLAAGGDLALVCRDAGARTEALDGIRRGLETGLVTPEAALRARTGRAGLRRRVEEARPRPDTSVIGCPEHRELLREIGARAAETGPRPPA
jgi:hypothetical protein